MVIVLVNPIDVWSKVIDHDIRGWPIWGMVDKDGKIKAHLSFHSPIEGKLKISIKGEKSCCVFSANWEPPDDKIEDALFSFFEQLIARLNLSHRGEWNENHT